MSESDTDVNWDEMDLGTDLGDGEVSRTVKDGRYLLKCEKMEIKARVKEDDPKKGEKYLNVRFRIMDSMEGYEGAIGESVFQIFNFGEKAIFMLKQWIKAALPTYTGSKIPKELEGTFVSGFVFTNEYGGYENLRIKQFKSANGWTGVNFIIDENGKLENIGKGKTDKSPKTETKPANGNKKSETTKKPASKPADGEDEVEV